MDSKATSLHSRLTGLLSMLVVSVGQRRGKEVQQLLWPGLCLPGAPQQHLHIPDWYVLAIVSEYGDEEVKMLSDEEEWRVVIDKLASRWNFPKSIGAIDEQHITLKAPANSSTIYHNYKGFFSVFFLALVDADYKFLWVDMGPTGLHQTVLCTISHSSRTNLCAPSVTRA